MTSPRPEKRYPVLSRLAAWTIRLIVLTCRIHFTDEGDSGAIGQTRTPRIYIFWHRHIFMMIHHFRKQRVHPLISHSRDGSLVSRVAEKFGMKPVRGSSSSGGARAFLEMTRCLQEMNEDVLITADGPKGPAGRIKEGLVRLAEKTAFPIVPIAWYGSRVKIFHKSWDRFMMPLPFSRIQVRAATPIDVKSLKNPLVFFQGELKRLESEAMRQTNPMNTHEELR